MTPNTGCFHQILYPVEYSIKSYGYTVVPIKIKLLILIINRLCIHSKYYGKFKLWQS